jgi:spore maturation protein CgeB
LRRGPPSGRFAACLPPAGGDLPRCARMRIVYFTHSLRSCWNHGNAHFLRGVLSELVAQGCEVKAWEPVDGWSAQNLLLDHGPEALAAWRAAYPELAAETYGADFDPARACDGADLVLVHEWTDPGLVARLGARRKRGGRFRLLFHDTHHRAVSDPAAMGALDLSGYDGVLAFGERLAEVYRRRGWGRRAYVWHEAADVRRFRPPERPTVRKGLVFVGNWGDEERTAELDSFLFRPAKAAGLPLDVWGVRYPDAARARLAETGARYCGWLPNFQAPEAFAWSAATVHVPRRFYATVLPGVPTIRVFEALACGVPLLSAPWEDAEGLFRQGRDFLMARSEAEMAAAMRAVAHDADLRAFLAASGLETIRARHTCAHRARELLKIAEEIGSNVVQLDRARAATRRPAPERVPPSQGEPDAVH